jgi:23S rRNA (cytidine1920-2'-O)/16S rRNA (cytidine1409-2'-O)-methyltransferase
MVDKLRLDRLLVARGIAPTREKARAMILAGQVEVEDHTVAKPGQAVAVSAAIEIRPLGPSRVGRAGEKLDGALHRLPASPAGRRALDIGASVGGFTECLLRRGAVSVIALDVGKGQLDWKLRCDPRVYPVEGINARYLQPSDLPPEAMPVEFVVCDVSFISLRLILPAIARVLGSGEAVVLVKPQFEAGRGQVGRGGIVRDRWIREDAVRTVIRAAEGCGFAILAACASPLPGAEGNVEFFLHLRPGAVPGPAGDLEETLQSALAESDSLAVRDPSREDA